jgi:eukaryotic-like serine/threonine-protein kinase
MLHLNQCPQCRAEIHITSPEGVCTRCLLAATLNYGDSWGIADDLLRSEVGEDVFLRRYGDYEILEEIGRGGVGVVYRAWQLTLGRAVALKLILAGPLATPEQLARFESEVEAAAQCLHPNIVPIYEIGEREGQYYYSMKLVDGTSMDKQLAALSKNPRAFASILAKTARAADCAHQKGVLHLDIKPNNIILDAALEPYLIDFGLARIKSAEARTSAQRIIFGTPSYMSPEQASGDVNNFSAATDVYGLGAVLYELLTGKPPFAGSNQSETLQQVRKWRLRQPSRLNPAVDSELERICLKCLDKKPARRFQTANDLADEMERWLSSGRQA